MRAGGGHGDDAQDPESAISCYLIIFLMRPNAAECVGQAVGLIVLVSLLVLALAPVIQALADTPLLRIAVIAGASFVFLYLSSATQLGEIGAIIGLVIAFILTMVDLIPAGEIVTRGLLYAWAMACMPMAWMAVFCLVLGTGPHTLVRRSIAERLQAAAEVLERDDRRAATAIAAEGQTELDKRMMMAQLFHTAPKAETRWLGGAAASAWRLMFAASALPADVSASVRQTLADQCRAAAAAIRDRGRALPQTAVAEDQAPQAGEALSAAQAGQAKPPTPPTGAEATVRAMLKGLARPDGGSVARPGKIPFIAADALSNPEHQQFALKTTAAALLAYFTYSLLNWEGIATAMVTCYVAALGTTGETAHKLMLRICGCLIGAAIGVGAILFVVPHLTSVGGLMALVFCAILPAAWVAMGPERISYGGVQIGLAFLLTVLTGFGPSTSLSAASDRIIGILLGNTLIFVMFTNFWPKSAGVEVRRQLAGALEALARLAAAPPGRREVEVNDVATVATMTARAKEALDMTPFEPRSQRPEPAEVRRLYDVVEEIAAMLPAALFSPQALDDVAVQLRAAAASLDPARAEARAGAGSAPVATVPPPATPDPVGGPLTGGAEPAGALLGRAVQIGRLAAGGAG